MRIGIDLGGTKIEAIALDRTGEILHRKRIASPQGDYDATLDAIHSLVTGTEQATGHSGTVGLGIPGTISKQTGLIKNANSTWLIGHPLDKDLAVKLGRPVRLENDANCFALSEASDGAAAGYDTVFGVILGTGVGGGLIVDGKVLGGVNSIGGEWGHNALPWIKADELPGADCYCGLKGCIETFISGPSLSRLHREKNGQDLTAQEIAAGADANDLGCLGSLTYYCDLLSRTLASVVNIFDPEAIVLGGGLSNVSRIYQQVPMLWSQYIFSDTVETKLLPPKHGDSSGVRGAAWLWSLDEAEDFSS